MLVVSDNEVGIRVDKYLSDKLNISRNKISKSKILVNNKLVKSSYKVEVNDKIEINLIEEENVEIIPEKIELEIVYEDKYFAVINKPYNMVVHPSLTHNSNTLVNAIMYKFDELSDINEEGKGIVHRLDKDTTGLIIIAKNNEIHTKFNEMFKEHSIEKTYLAILKGKMTKEKIRIESYIGRSKKDRKKISSNTNKGKLAISIFELLSNNEKNSFVKVNILTGRTHQIRVHAKEMNHPIIGDAVYGKKDNIERQQLHSYRLKFIHPITKENIEILSKIPKDMEENLRKMKLEVDYARI